MAETAHTAASENRELQRSNFFSKLSICKCWGEEKSEDYHDDYPKPEVFEAIDVDKIKRKVERAKSIEVRKVAHARLQSERAIN